MLRLVIAAFILLLANFVRAEVILASGSYKILTEVFNEQTAMQLQNASQAEKLMY